MVRRMTFVDTRSIDYGDAGVMQTLAAMAALINDGVNQPPVVEFARQLAVTAGTRRYAQQAFAIREWLRSVWRFVDDPPDRELLRDSVVMLREYMNTGIITGDCDEVAILGATLGKAIGLQAELVALAFFNQDGTPGRYEHVYAILTTATGAQVDVDVTRPGIIPAIARQAAIGV
jgi:transglutaminase-like putative cysteine protease